MFERLNSSGDAFDRKLGAALEMEHTVLEILDDAIEKARGERLRELLGSHRSESEQHVANVERAFRTLGWNVDDSPCPSIDGLRKEAKANLRKSDEEILDSVILQGTLEVEHHEIGVYENLLITAQAAGQHEVARVLHHNLESEQAALGQVRSLLAEVAPSAPALFV